jgi:hypothetical protein
VAVLLHAFLIWAPNGNWSASCLGWFMPGNRATSTYCTVGWLGPRAVMEAAEERKNLCWGVSVNLPVTQPTAPSLFLTELSQLPQDTFTCSLSWHYQDRDQGMPATVAFGRGEEKREMAMGSIPGPRGRRTARWDCGASAWKQQTPPTLQDSPATTTTVHTCYRATAACDSSNEHSHVSCHHHLPQLYHPVTVPL